jgi:hypothetical protein
MLVPSLQVPTWGDLGGFWLCIALCPEIFTIEITYQNIAKSHSSTV